MKWIGVFLLAVALGAVANSSSSAPKTGSKPLDVTGNWMMASALVEDTCAVVLKKFEILEGTITQKGKSITLVDSKNKTWTGELDTSSGYFSLTTLDMDVDFEITSTVSGIFTSATTVKYEIVFSAHRFSDDDQICLIKGRGEGYAKQVAVGDAIAVGGTTGPESVTSPGMAAGSEAVSPGTVDLQAIRKSAEKGDAEAQFSLGVAYTIDKGVAHDYVEAVTWFHRAAEQGHVDAQYALGVMSILGKGMPKDAGEAVKWYRIAAEQGHAAAQYQLGTAYAEGEDVVKDVPEAVKWLYKAAAQGVVEAEALLKELQ